MIVDGLSKLLEPLPREEFLASCWGKTFKHVRGGAGKFARLMPWERLNEILRRHRLDYPRLRLVREGQTLPAASCLRYAAAWRGRGPIPRLKPVEFNEQLRRGATLVLDAVDELSEPTEELAASLEHAFRESVQINCYAGWRAAHGFDLHFDRHDVFILQVAGRKRWSVYGETRPHPVADDGEAAPPPEGPPLWEGVLEDGDLLYMPRGWWHVAAPLNEPTLHLTVGVHRRTGLDFLKWLAERMRKSEAFRADLPRLATGEDRAAHAARLREELFAEWDDGLVGRYLAEYDAQAMPRARASLPWAAAGALPESSGAVLRWTPPRPVELAAPGGVVEFTCNRVRWRFAEPALAVLRPLAERRVCTVGELCEAAAGQLDERTARAFLRELLLHGLVAIVDGKAADSRQ
ncbi:MAG TPA: cupin domain-containing protein [Pyrinomonadaceae bacterium]|nr:cupin domain-containing protein [Pyrinomonadaceae bacterium]